MRTNLKVNESRPGSGTRMVRCAACGLTALVLLSAAGCRGRATADAEAHTRPATAPAPFSLAGGTPAGGLRDWIGDVRRALGPLPAEAARDPSSAQKTALETYLTRQEYIEMYWGVTGKLTRGAALGPAVKEAETRFHAILAQLMPGHAPQAAQLRAGIDSLSVQYDRVIGAAEAAQVPLDPHALVAHASAGSVR